MNGKAGLLELRPHISYRSYWNYSNHKLETSFLHIDNHWEWQNGLEIHTGINFTSEGVFKPFEIASKVVVPAGTYHHSEAQLVLMTNTSKNISVNIRSVIGGFFGGNRISTTGGVNVRLGDKFTSEWAINNNTVKSVSYTHLDVYKRQQLGLPMTKEVVVSKATGQYITNIFTIMY